MVPGGGALTGPRTTADWETARARDTERYAIYSLKIIFPFMAGSVAFSSALVPH